MAPIFGGGYEGVSLHNALKQVFRFLLMGLFGSGPGTITQSTSSGLPGRILRSKSVVHLDHVVDVFGVGSDQDGAVCSLQPVPLEVAVPARRDHVARLEVEDLA